MTVATASGATLSIDKIVELLGKDADYLLNHTSQTIAKETLHLPGGDLELEWAESGEVFMTGPATEVFSGVWPE